MECVLGGGMQWESEVSRCDETAVTVALWCRLGLHPPARLRVCVGGGGKRLAEAGDVSFSTGGCHDALSGAARNVVVNLGTWGNKGRA